MKKKLLCQLMAITIVGTMISGDVLAASPNKAVVQKENAPQADPHETLGNQQTALEDAQTGTEGQSDDTVTGSEETPDDTVTEPEETPDDTVTGPEETPGDTVTEPEETPGDTVAEPEETPDDTITEPEAENGAGEDAVQGSEDALPQEALPNVQEHAPSLMNLPEEDTKAYTEFNGSYNYTTPNDSVTLSPSNLKASDVVEEAVGIISKNEGTYNSVAADDEGALSFGKLMWHGQNALSVLREIIMQDKEEAKRLLGDTFYREVMDVKTNWSERILTSGEVTKMRAFLNTSQSKQIQDKIERSSIAKYVNSGIKKGLRNAAALVYYADLENQGGSGGAGRCLTNAAKLTGSASTVTLNELHIASITDNVLGEWINGGWDFRPRRSKVYGYASSIGWSYHRSKDSLIPYKTLSASNQTGTKWLQWALNVYCGADLKVNGSYDAATMEAVKKLQKETDQAADGLAGYKTIDAVMMKIVASGKYNPGSSDVVVDPGEEPDGGNSDYEEPTGNLKLGSTGSQVKWLQSALNKVLGTSLEVDGEFGKSTKDAVIQFQKKIGLSADGIFGSGSKAAMKPLLTVQSSKPTVKVSTKDGQNTVTWSAVSGVSGYKVYRKTASGSWQLLSTVGAGTTNLVDKTAKEGTVYYYTAKGYRTAGSLTVNGQYVSDVKVTTSKKPGTGSNNTNNNTSDGGYKEPAGNLKLGSKGSEVKWLQSALNKVLGTKLEVDGEFGKGTKDAVIQFQKKTGLSADGIFGSGSKAAMKPLLTVQSSKPTVKVSTKDGQNTVTWSAVSGASGYRVYRKTTSGSWELLSVVKSGNTTSYVDKTAKAGTSYYYTSKAYRTDGSLTVYGQYVSDVKVTTSKKPGTGSNNTNNNTSNGGYKEPAGNLKLGSKGSEVKWLQSALNKVLGTKLEVDGAFGKGTKDAVIQFQKKTGLSADGIFGSGSKAAMKPLLSVQSSKPAVKVSTKNGQNTVTWSKVSGASGYRVYRKTASGSWELLSTVKSGNTISYVDKTAKAGTSYYYTSKAYRTDGSLTVYGQYVSNVKITTSKKTGSGGTSSGNTNTSAAKNPYKVPTKTLKTGSRGNDVKWLQWSLNKVCGSKLEVDGIYGSGTKKAVASFQKKYKLSADGIFGSKSLAKMKTLVTSSAGGTSSAGSSHTSASQNPYKVPTKTLKMGSRGNDVKWLQWSLNKVCSAKLGVDGIYGSGTKKAVTSFQKQYKLSADGIFGTKSLAKMKTLI